MSESKTKFDSTNIKETVRLKCSKAIFKKILAVGIFVFLIGSIVATACLVLVVGSKSPGKEDEKDMRSLAASFDCRQKPLCDANAACTADLRDKKRYICVCNNGFEGNGSVCRDEKDERILGTLTFDCTQKPLCDANAICKADLRDEKRYICVCNNGFIGNGSVCRDINECLSQDLHSCPFTAKCENTIGSYQCSCLPGFHGGGKSCQDIDECKANMHNCSVHALCNNTIGSYACSCLPGFKGNGWSCHDINECKDGTHKCHTYAACTNIGGSHECSCLSGFRGDGQVCRDVDECLDGSHDCSLHATCMNTVGSYSCSCNDGFYGNGRTCTDVDECSERIHLCDAHASCVNKPGSYSCSCRKGYTGNGRHCKASAANQGQTLNKQTIIIIASVCGFIVIMAFVCCFVLCFCRQKRR